MLMATTLKAGKRPTCKPSHRLDVDTRACHWRLNGGIPPNALYIHFIDHSIARCWILYDTDCMHSRRSKHMAFIRHNS